MGRLQELFIFSLITSPNLLLSFLPLSLSVSLLKVSVTPVPVSGKIMRSEGHLSSAFSEW